MNVFVACLAVHAVLQWIMLSYVSRSASRRIRHLENLSEIQAKLNLSQNQINRGIAELIAPALKGTDAPDTNVGNTE